MEIIYFLWRGVMIRKSRPSQPAAMVGGKSDVVHGTKGECIGLCNYSSNSYHLFDYVSFPVKYSLVSDLVCIWWSTFFNTTYLRLSWLLDLTHCARAEQVELFLT